MVRLRWNHEGGNPEDAVKMGLFRELSSSLYISKFRNLMRTGEFEDFSEYLETLKRILRKDFPKDGEMEKCVPRGSEAREKYEEAAEELGTVPGPDESREVYLRIAKGPKYESYRERAERILAKIEAIEEMAGKIKKLKPYSPRRTPTRTSSRLVRAFYLLEIEGNP